MPSGPEKLNDSDTAEDYSEYAEFFRVLKRDKAFAKITFTVREGIVTMIELNQTYKDIKNANLRKGSD